DAFVAKVRADGTGLVYCGYIGGADADSGYGIAVDAIGNAYVAGYTQSDQATFPVTVGPDLTFNGSLGTRDAFVAKVGALIDLEGSAAVGGVPVVGANVILTNMATRAKLKAITDATGAYQSGVVAPGTYKITIQRVGVTTTTTVSGTVEVRETPSVGNKVRLKSGATKVRFDTTTDSTGAFSFAGVVPGSYKLTIQLVTLP
ncbi:MAG TPA: carboxypeptidase regulatory-like domain-containing protein, partial [Candidatus Methylomirabilis sp.]|nr:carboxypeptidase regulatory-like domain-containing protein [Candidatus Methylomirabilis sp.]